MPRMKKDGRHINYYIDREIYERLERYAQDKGQPMTTAIESILREHLDRHGVQRRAREGERMFCSRCNLLVSAPNCAVCGSRKLREPRGDDYCYLTEKDAIWAGALSGLLRQNEIPFVTKEVLGAGLAAKIGPALERTRFYVPYACYPAARELEHEFFAAPAKDDA